MTTNVFTLRKSDIKLKMRNFTGLVARLKEYLEVLTLVSKISGLRKVTPSLIGLKEVS